MAGAGGRYVATGLSLLLVAVPAAAQEARVPVHVIEGRLVVRCDVSTRARRIPVNLFVDYDRPCGLELHNRAAAGIFAEAEDGTPRPITIHLPGLDVTVPRRELGDEDELERFTKWYSTELGENAVVGTIGAGVLEDHHVAFDLRDGFLEIGPPRELSPMPPEDEPGWTTVTITVDNHLVWLPVVLADGRPASLGLSTTRYDTIADEELCARLGSPAGDVGPVRIGDHDLSEFVALRPAPLHYAHADGALGMIGIGLLRHFRIEIDRVNRRARLAQTAPADFPEEDLELFRALVADDPVEVEAWLERHPDARLSREAADLLIDLRLAYGAEAEAFEAAIRWFDDTRIEDLRTTESLELMKKLERSGFPEHVPAAGELGIEAGREDRYPNAVHEVHAMLGRVHLERGDDEEAWRHLLSAAFGMPEDGPVNLNLGRFYERGGRYRRAYSRFVQAVCSPESGEEALAGLERLQPLLGEGERMSVDLVERLIGGKVQSFGAATQFAATPQNTAGRVVLAEYFTSAHISDRAIGGTLGRDGLISHFQPEHAVFVAYHLSEPEPDPLANELSDYVRGLYGIEEPAHLFNGVARGPALARVRDKETVYERCRGIVLDQLMRPPDYDVLLEARIEDGVVTGEVVVYGPAWDGLTVQVLLVEKGVLFPGKSTIVVHHGVARAHLTDDVAGVPFRPDGDRMVVPFARSLADVEDANRAWLERLTRRTGGAVSAMGGRLDPEQLRVVALVRDLTTKEVLQAAQEDARPVEEGEGER